MAGNTGLRVADFVRRLRHDRRVRVADISRAARADALRIPMVPDGGVVLVSVDLLDRSVAARLFPGARRPASVGELVVCKQSQSNLVRVCRSGGDLLLSPQTHRAAALQRLPGDPRVLDAGVFRRMGRHPSPRAAARLDAECQHSIYSARHRAAHRHRDEPQPDPGGRLGKTEGEPAAPIRRIRRDRLPAGGGAGRPRFASPGGPDHALYLFLTGPDATVPLRLFRHDALWRDLLHRAPVVRGWIPVAALAETSFYRR